MRTIIVRDMMHIPIGRQGENDATRVVWPDYVTAWAALYGTGTFQLAVKRPRDDTPYPVALALDGTNVVWTVAEADLVDKGNGACELTYIVDKTVAKSKVWGTVVAASITGNGTTDPPVAERGWVDKVLAAGASAEDAAKAAESSAGAAADAAKAAQDATEHPPRINEETQTWLIWQDGEYQDTGLPIAIDGSLPPGGDPGDIVVRTTDGAQWQPDQLTDEELLQAMIDTDTLAAVHDSGGILTDENGRIILW